MKPEYLMISGIARGNWHRITADVNNAVSAAGGWVIDRTLFSNIAIAIRFSLPSPRLDDFQRRVVAAGVEMNNDSRARIRAMIEARQPCPADWTVSLNITFMHDEPDLRRKIPAVPG